MAARDHPDARAVFYETPVYTKRKIDDLMRVLKAFGVAAQIRDKLHVAGGSRLLDGLDAAPMLQRVLHTRFPDLRPLLDYFARTYDEGEAKKGAVTPAPGVSPEYDAAVAEISAIKSALRGGSKAARGRG